LLLSVFVQERACGVVWL